MRVGWISTQPEASDFFPNLSDCRPQYFPWTPSRFAFCTDHAEEQAVHSDARSFEGFIVSGLSLIELESLYNLRALQLLDREGRLDIPSIVFVRCDSTSEALLRFGQRVRSGWPFRSALFIADAATVDLLHREGLFAMEASEARRSSLSDLFGRNEGTFLDKLNDQILAVQIQPPWPYGGSHIVFANQIDALLDRNWFILRIIVDSEAGAGPTMRRRMNLTVAEANIDATPHLDTVACADGTPESINASNADELYRRTIRNRMQAVMADELVARLAARADVAIVNYTVHMGFALKACPAAKLVLETHDDITRMNVARSRTVANHPLFRTRMAVKRHLRLERLIWKAADVCVALSLSELKKIRRHAPTVYVLPRPYARPSRGVGSDACWDILIVMNPHPFNVQCLDDFLENVVLGDPRLMLARFAIVGRINEWLESKWKDRLPNAQWLGYVRDIDDLRDSTRLSVCPDQNGTGVAIKTLTCIAAAHPLVATPTALRGLPDAILDLITPADDAAELKRQILELLANDDLLLERGRRVRLARRMLWPAEGHEKALTLAREMTEDKSPLRKEFLAVVEADAPQANPVQPTPGRRLIQFGEGGNDRPYLRRGWLHDEPGGRWSDGASAMIRIPASWLAPPGLIVLSFLPDFRGPDIVMKHKGIPLPSVYRGNGRMIFDFDVPEQITDPFVEFEIVCSTVICPKDAGISNDERVLGVHVRSIKVVRSDRLAVPAAWIEGFAVRVGGVMSRIMRS